MKRPRPGISKAMLSPSVLRRMALALLFLVSAALLLRTRSGGRQETMASRDFPRKTAYFEISRNTETWKFRRLRNGWVLSEPFEYPADSAAIRALLVTAAKSRVSTPLVLSSSSASAFGISEGDSVTAVFMDDVQAPLLRLSTGKEAEQPESFYWQDKAGAIRLAEDFPSAFLKRPFYDWLDRTAAFLPGGPAFVRVSCGKSSFTVEQSSAAWRLRGRGEEIELSSAALAGFLPSFVPSLDAAALSPYQDCAPMKEELRLEVKPDGPALPYLFSIGQAEKGFRRARRAGEGRVCFLFSDEKLSSLLQMGGLACGSPGKH